MQPYITQSVFLRCWSSTHPTDEPRRKNMLSTGLMLLLWVKYASGLRCG